jgi:hypothetical protein
MTSRSHHPGSAEEMAGGATMTLTVVQMARAGKSLLRSSGLRVAADDLGRGQKLRAAATQRAALAGALPENLLTRRRKQATLRRASPSRRHVRFVAMGQNLPLPPR